MLIENNLTNCRKPRQFAFRGNPNPSESGRVLRYKHFEQIDDDTLKLKSIIKAHQDVKESGKMRLFKAVPAITTTLLTTSIALAQPGKFAAKAAAGLGFLVLSDLIGLGFKHIQNKPKQNKETNPLATIAKVAAATAVGVFALKGLKTTKLYKKVLKPDFRQLAKEINSTDFGKYFNKKIAPFVNKHATKFALAPYGIIATSALGQVGLSKSLSKDIKDQASFNYLKGKLIQQEARTHFDLIDAQEV